MEFRVPELGEGVYEAEFVQWLVRLGDTVQLGQSLAEVVTDKATMELPSPFAGTVESLAVEPGQMVGVGQVILQYAPSAGTRFAATAPGVAQTHPARRQVGSTSASRPVLVDDPEHPRPRGTVARRRLQAAPAVRRMARSMGVDLNDVKGTGPDGRILIHDLGAFVQSWKARERRTSKRSNAMDLGTPGERIKFQGVRRTIAEHMVVAKKTIPHYSYIDECDVTEMVALRNEIKRPLYAERVKLTNLPFYVKAVTAALKQVPIVNASLNEEAGEIVLHDEYHIGIATATSKGLVVPVIRHADRLDLAGIAREIERLIRSAQAGSILREELRGSTFTISSVGNIGGLVSTPIINYPEVGILAIGRALQRPVFSDTGEIVPAKIVYLSFSFDHRVIDGSVGAIFGNCVIEQLQHPRRLLN